MSTKNCGICDKAFSSTRNYEKHLVSRSHLQLIENDNPESTRCSLCNEDFSCKSVRDSHMVKSRHKNRIELGDGMCCGRKFDDVYSLRKHRKTTFHAKHKSVPVYESLSMILKRNKMQ